MNPSDLSCGYERQELYPTSDFASLVLEVRLLQSCLVSFVILWSFLQSFSRPISLWIYFSEDGWLWLYRQNIPLMPYMSVIVSDVSELYCLICSRIVFVCLITVLHWWFIIIKGSANNQIFILLGYSQLTSSWLTAATLIYGPQVSDLALCSNKIHHLSSSLSGSFSVMLSPLPALCHQHVYCTLVKLLNKTNPKTDSWWTLLVYLHSWHFLFPRRWYFSFFVYLPLKLVSLYFTAAIFSILIRMQADLSDLTA